VIREGGEAIHAWKHVKETEGFRSKGGGDELSGCPVSGGSKIWKRKKNTGGTRETEGGNLRGDTEGKKNGEYLNQGAEGRGA